MKGVVVLPWIIRTSGDPRSNVRILFATLTALWMTKVCQAFGQHLEILIFETHLNTEGVMLQRLASE
jgi:hypothetical protein